MNMESLGGEDIEVTAQFGRNDHLRVAVRSPEAELAQVAAGDGQALSWIIPCAQTGDALTLALEVVEGHVQQPFRPA